MLQIDNITKLCGYKIITANIEYQIGRLSENKTEYHFNILTTSGSLKQGFRLILNREVNIYGNYILTIKAFSGHTNPMSRFISFETIKDKSELEQYIGRMVNDMLIK